MNFKESHEKLKAIAAGKYFVLRYGISEYSNGIKFQECGVYVDGRNWHTDSTWEDAFDKLNNEINPPDPRNIKIENIPELQETP